MVFSRSSGWFGFNPTVTTAFLAKTPALADIEERIRMQPTATASIPPPADMDLQAMQSMDWLFKKERIYLLAQFWQQVSSFAFLFKKNYKLQNIPPLPKFVNKSASKQTIVNTLNWLGILAVSLDEQECDNKTLNYNVLTRCLVR